MRTMIRWAITQRMVVIRHRRLGTTFRSHLQLHGFLTLEGKTDRLSRNVRKNYHYTLRNRPVEGSSQLHRGGSLKYRWDIYMGTFSPISKYNCIVLTLETAFFFLPFDWTTSVSLLNPTGHVMHQQFNFQQLYVRPTLYLCVLYLSENKQRLVPLTA